MTKHTKQDELDKLLHNYFEKRAKALRRHVSQHRRDPEHTAVDDSIRDITANAKEAIQAHTNKALQTQKDELLDWVESEVVGDRDGNGSWYQSQTELSFDMWSLIENFKEEQRQTINNKRSES